MAQSPIRLFFVGSYCEICDQTGPSAKPLKKFGQEFVTTDHALATRLVSIEEGPHRVAHFVTEDEFRSVFLNNTSPDQPQYDDKVGVLQRMLHTPGNIAGEAAPTHTDEEKDEDA